jgi:hypothetical protein
MFLREMPGIFAEGTIFDFNENLILNYCKYFPVSGKIKQRNYPDLKSGFIFRCLADIIQAKVPAGLFF